jgi:hypothetical protein
MLRTRVIFISKNEQSLNLALGADEVRPLLEACLLVEVLPTNGRSPNPRDTQVGCESRNQIINRPQLTMSFNQDITLAQDSLRNSPREILLQTLSAKDIAQCH